LRYILLFVHGILCIVDRKGLELAVRSEI
jgi:hypothetical protein